MTARMTSSLALMFVVLAALCAQAGCADGEVPPEPQCSVDGDCGFESQVCRDAACVDRDTTVHAECCACLALHDCLRGALTEDGCSDSLDRAQPIDADGACVDDEARCAQACDFLVLP